MWIKTKGSLHIIKTCIQKCECVMFKFVMYVLYRVIANFAQREKRLLLGQFLMNINENLNMTSLDNMK